jgi:hypothetical protein
MPLGIKYPHFIYSIVNILFFHTKISCRPFCTSTYFKDEASAIIFKSHKVGPICHIYVK